MQNSGIILTDPPILFRERNYVLVTYHVLPRTKADMVSAYSEHLSQWLNEVFERHLGSAAIVTEQWIVTAMQAC
jgi:hypothetical protein